MTGLVAVALRGDSADQVMLISPPSTAAAHVCKYPPPSHVLNSPGVLCSTSSTQLIIPLSGPLMGKLALQKLRICLILCSSLNSFHVACICICIFFLLLCTFFLYLVLKCVVSLLINTKMCFLKSKWPMNVLDGWSKQN